MQLRLPPTLMLLTVGLVVQLAAVGEAWNALTFAAVALTASCLQIRTLSPPLEPALPEPVAPEPEPELVTNFVPTGRPRNKYRGYRLEKPFEFQLRNREAPTGNAYCWGQVEDWFQ